MSRMIPSLILVFSVLRNATTKAWEVQLVKYDSLKQEREKFDEGESATTTAAGSALTCTPSKSQASGLLCCTTTLLLLPYMTL